MDVEGPGKMDGILVERAFEDIANLLRRPGFRLDAEFSAQQPSLGVQLRIVTEFRDGQPAIHRLDTRHAGLSDGGAHVVEAPLGQSPELLGMVQPDAVDNAIQALEEAGQHETQIAPRRPRGDGLRLQHGHRPAAPRNLAGRGQAGETAANDADVHIEIEGQSGAVGRRDGRFPVPARPAGN
jgi:hypothetical protein